MLRPWFNTGEASGDTYASIENVAGSRHHDDLRGDHSANGLYGGTGDDALYGRAGDDTLSGGAGDDILVGGIGKDRLDGGVGVDTASYFWATATNASSGLGLTVDLVAANLNTGEAAGDSYVSIENIVGSRYDDDLYGDEGDNSLVGGSGDDWLFGRGGTDVLVGGHGYDLLYGGTDRDRLHGGDGNDQLTGGEGSDVLIGGTGSDLFVFDAPIDGITNVDEIDDFEVDVDQIWLAQSVFDTLATGSLSSGAFCTGASAADGDDRIVYDSGSGGLFYDADGAGGAGQVPFAMLGTGLALDALDFLVG